MPKQHDESQTQQTVTPAASQYSLDLTETRQLVPAISPFYQHPPASHERDIYGKSLDVNVLEKGYDDLTPATTKSNDPFCSSISVNANKECAMWPSRQTLAQNNMADKKKKRSSHLWACAGPRDSWANLHKKQKLLISLVVALLLIGAMIGLGVGISKSVHAGSYHNGST